MAKVGVSISMDAETASVLKSEALEHGESFSERVCRFIFAGRNLEMGLFSSTPAPEPEPADEASASEPVPLKDRVYSCVSTEHQPLTDIAEKAGVSVDQVGDILEGLSDSGEPIILRVIDGVWYGWEER